MITFKNLKSFMEKIALNPNIKDDTPITIIAEETDDDEREDKFEALPCIGIGTIKLKQIQNLKLGKIPKGHTESIVFTIKRWPERMTIKF